MMHLPKAKQVVCSSWKFLRKELDSLCRHTSKSLLFRGQNDATYGLVPALFRGLKLPFGTRDLGPIDVASAFWPYLAPLRQQLISSCVKHFVHGAAEIMGRLGDTSIRCDLTDDSLMALGRHYGLHVPTLDWSRDPYVAVYFALDNAQPPRAAAVWVLGAKPLSNALRRLPPATGLLREKAQSAVQLEIKGSGFDFETALAETGDINDLTCLLLGVETWEPAKVKLERRGVTRSLVYPDSSSKLDVGTELEEVARRANTAKQQVVDDFAAKWARERDSMVRLFANTEWAKLFS